MTDNSELQKALREFLWMAVCWNDHNFHEGVIAMKCRDLCEGLGVEDVDAANKLMDSVEIK